MKDLKGKVVREGDNILFISARLSTSIFKIGKVVGFTNTMVKVQDDTYVKNVKNFYKIDDDITEEIVDIFNKIQ